MRMLTEINGLMIQKKKFPEAISIDNGKKYVNPYFINYPDDNEEYPRFCALPETEPLNILIGEDINS